MRRLVLAGLLLLGAPAAQAQSTCAPSVACAVALARADAARAREYRDTLVVSVAIEGGHALAQAGLRTEAQAAYADARAGIARLRDRELREGWTRTMATSLVYAGFVDEALETADRDPDQVERLNIYRAAVWRHARDNAHAQALQIAARAGAAHRDDVILDGVRSLTEAGLVDEARTLAAALPDSEQGRAAYLIGVSLLQRRDFVGAAEAFARVGGSEAYTLHQMASAQYAAGDVAAAQQSMRTALALAQPNDDPFGREIGALVLVRQLTDVDMFAEALAHVSEAPRDEQANLVSDIAIAQAWVGEAEAAERTFAQMMSMDDAVFHRDETRAGIAGGRAVNGEPWRTAFANVTDPSVRQTALIETAPVLALKGRIDDARDMLRDAAETARRIRFGEEIDSALTEVVLAQIESGLLDEARATANSIQGTPARASALAYVARALHTAGDVDAARAAFASAAELARSDPEAFDTFFALPVEMAELGLVDEALAVARMLPTSDPDNAMNAFFALSHVAAGYAKAGQPATAFALIADIEDPQWRSVGFMDIARAMVRE